MAGHAVAKVARRGRVRTVTCECGAAFPSIESEAFARSYHSAHRRLMRAERGIIELLTDRPKDTP